MVGLFDLVRMMLVPATSEQAFKLSEIHQTTNVKDAILRISRLLGIEANLIDVEDDATRTRYGATLRHTLPFVFQPQFVVAKPLIVRSGRRALRVVAQPNRQPPDAHQAPRSWPCLTFEFATGSPSSGSTIHRRRIPAGVPGCRARFSPSWWNKNSRSARAWAAGRPVHGSVACPPHSVRPRETALQPHLSTANPIMKLQILTGRIARPQKAVIFGPEGIGKSTLAAQFPAPVSRLIASVMCVGSSG